MENKINVAELLKDCPKGMELDCSLFNNPVRYDSLDNNDNYPIIILTENDDYLYLTEEGYLYNMPNSKCVIFPKGKTTWEGFVLPCKFKVGDKVKSIFNNTQYIITALTDTHYTLVEVNDGFKYLEPIIEDKHWELVPNKFDISTLKPFESRVLIRNDESQYWIPAFWGYKRNDGYVTTFGWCKYCIPFDGNENLLGTNNDCDDFYKNWI